MMDDYEEQPEDIAPIDFTLSLIDDGPGNPPRIVATADRHPVSGQAGTVEDAVRALTKNVRSARKAGTL